MYRSSTFSLGQSSRRQRKAMRKSLASNGKVSLGQARDFSKYHSIKIMQTSIDSINLEISALRKRIRQLNGEHVPNAKNPLKSIIWKIGADRTFNLIKSEKPVIMEKFGDISLLGRKYFGYENSLSDIRENIMALEKKRSRILDILKATSGAK